MPATETENPTNGSSGASGLGELRKIIVQAEHVSDVLPDALSHGAEKDDRLAAATLPIVEENIRQSVQRNPRVLAEAIFPIIGPAIRKAISEALAQMVQSLNQTLESSLSPKGLKWRLEAMQTGRPFAEVVILHSLVYRVEQVFLIHKKTGILLQHVAINQAQAQDGELVSAMLTAIQDFVNDSFETGEGATLDTLKVRDFSIWIENSPDAILAAVIRGTAPLSLREVFLEAIEKIQLEQDVDFDRFEGDTTIFEDAKPVLQECLQVELENKPAEKKGFLTPFNAIAGVLLLVLLVGGFFAVRSHLRWSNYVARLNAEPGIVVTEADGGFFTPRIYGLRDELATDPRLIATEFGYKTEDIVHSWKPFQDASPEFVLQRAWKVLEPPSRVRLSLDERVLTVDGAVDADWFKDARRLAASLAGVEQIRIGFDGQKTMLESRTVKFKCGTSEFDGGQSEILDQIAASIGDMDEAAKREGWNYRLDAIGFADATGSPETNAALSLARATRVRETLVAGSSRLSGVTINTLVEPSGGECAVHFRVVTE